MRLLFVNEVARLLGVSEAWLRGAEKHGRIPKVDRDMNGAASLQRKPNYPLCEGSSSRTVPRSSASDLSGSHTYHALRTLNPSASRPERVG
jgi:hypothetical protein